MANVVRPRPPSIERILAVVRPRLPAPIDQSTLTSVVREVVEIERDRRAADAGLLKADRWSVDLLADEVLARLTTLETSWSEGLEPVINGTGVIIHTNLGRAAWPADAIAAARLAAGEPLMLELDPETGRRGRRYRAAEDGLIALTGAEDALVTNNNAAAVALAVGLAGRGGGVVVSRGELVEIGGGVRIPEIVRRAGARLIEVGTTNRTRVGDFEEPLAGGRAKLVLRVHRSNFRLVGFTEDPEEAALVELAHRHGALVVDDLGSGALIDTSRFGLSHEPMPSERLASGADIVTFSGDKLVGGPQAGLIVGRAHLIALIRKDPLARAMRPDKVTLAAVAATLGLYRSGRAETTIPVWQAISVRPSVLEARAGALAERLEAEVVALQSTVGGGSLPGETLPSFGLALRGRSADRLLARLRIGRPSVIGRIEDGRVVIDLRTVNPTRDDDLAAALTAAVGVRDRGNGS
jgi:L-seryl-tRNA(Ser) seleniumtransferase